MALKASGPNVIVALGILEVVRLVGGSVLSLHERSAGTLLAVLPYERACVLMARASACDVSTTEVAR